jgi:hypothetical protein
VRAHPAIATWAQKVGLSTKDKELA